MEKALFVGNDINNATQANYSWQDLINGLLEYAQVDANLNQVNKPFPMLYEEIYLNAVKAHGTTEIRLKKYIASKTRDMLPNDLHRQILNLGIENIITSNYDLSFEKTAGLSETRCRNSGIIKESLYNVFRFHSTDSHKIWHIHGSQSLPKSITLGYEHYSGYLQQMRNYVATGTRTVYKSFEFLPIVKRLEKNQLSNQSWIDFFFTHDIHILGLNLDFVEMHLWWLINYRARILLEGRYPVKNKIVYYYPKAYEEKSRHKLEMFNINQVETVPVKLTGNNKIKYYETIIKMIANS